MQAVGVIGLGNMGRGMALSLQRGGFAVHGYDASPDAAAQVARQGIAISSTLDDLISRVDVVVLSLPSSDVVESVVLGEAGVAARGKAGLLVIDTTTADPASTKDVAQALQSRGMAFIDAPVSGGAKGAHAATLTMVIGGSTEDIARAEPVLAALTARRVHVGPVSAGHTAKLLNNLLCGTHLIIAAEAARLAAAAGLDSRKIFEGINAGSGRSAVTEVNFPSWIFNEAFDSGFTMDLMRKDMRLAMGLIDKLNISNTLLASAAGQLWEASQGHIPGDADFNRIAEFISASAMPAFREHDKKEARHA